MAKADGWKSFVELSAKMASSGHLEEFLDLFHTLEEKKDLGLRLLLVRALLEGKLSQREIAQELGVSIAKITRGSNALKITSEKLKKLIQK